MFLSGTESEVHLEAAEMHKACDMRLLFAIQMTTRVTRQPQTSKQPLCSPSRRRGHISSDFFLEKEKELWLEEKVSESHQMQLLLTLQQHLSQQKDELSARKVEQKGRNVVCDKKRISLFDETVARSQR